MPANRPSPADHALIDRFRAARRDPSLAVLEGFHALKHALRFGATIEAACTPDRARLEALAAALAPDLSPLLSRLVATRSLEVFGRLAPVAPATRVMAIARRPAIDPAAVLEQPRAGPIILLEQPADPGNLGAAVRVAAAAGAAAVLTTGRHDPWQPAALRGAAGLHFALPVARIGALPATGRPLIAIHPDGEPLHPAAISSGAILMFGGERRGLSADLLERAGRTAAIPMRPGVSSLNLATAVAVVLYAWRLGHSRPGPDVPATAERLGITAEER